MSPGGGSRRFELVVESATGVRLIMMGSFEALLAVATEGARDEAAELALELQDTADGFVLFDADPTSGLRVVHRWRVRPARPLAPGV